MVEYGVKVVDVMAEAVKLRGLGLDQPGREQSVRYRFTVFTLAFMWSAKAAMCAEVFVTNV